MSNSSISSFSPDSDLSGSESVSSFSPPSSESEGSFERRGAGFVRRAKQDSASRSPSPIPRNGSVSPFPVSLSPARSSSPALSSAEVSEELLSEDSEVDDPEAERWSKFGESVVPGIEIRDFIPAHVCANCPGLAACIYCTRCLAYYCQAVIRQTHFVMCCFVHYILSFVSVMIMYIAVFGVFTPGTNILLTAGA
jgi:hypothetical protein